VTTLRGMGVSSGVAIGRAVCLETRSADVFRIPLEPGQVEAEIERFRAAVARAEEEIGRNRSSAAALGEELAAIFDAHALMLGDARFADRIEESIRSKQVNAEWVVHRTTEDLVQRFQSIDDPTFRERADDVRDVGRYLLRVLQGISHHDFSEVEGDVILIADDLTPSDAVRFGRKGVAGFAVESGGRTSHTSIIARSLNLPLVSGLSGVVQLVTDNDMVVVDGDAGTLILHPNPEEVARHEAAREELRRREALLLATRDLRALTRDGVAVRLQANIDLPEEIDDAMRFGAEGVGLYRSEFLYIENSPRIPTEEDHLAIYRRLAEASAPHPAIVRTYDLGGRKIAREVMETEEENPVLGMRGIRLTLARPQMFRIQLRALYRAAVHGDLWILLPMIATIQEVRRFRAFAGAVVDELQRDGVPHRRDVKVGVMIEVPSAALIADLLAREVDFFAIGTNDLIQYSLAVDRNNEHVADLYQPFHPAIVRMIRFVVESAEAAGIPVSVCGEMAADPRAAQLLVGLGVRSLSMVARTIPEIKTRLREMDLGQWAKPIRRCAEVATADEVRGLLDQESARLALQGEKLC
jgi:phosphotransferase system enzyme I (PtsI)